MSTRTKNYGWICPRCGKVKAPDVKECDCKPEEPLIIPTAPFNAPLEYPTLGYNFECCKNCNNNPSVNPNASGVCCCSLPYLEWSQTHKTKLSHTITNETTGPYYEIGSDGQLRMVYYSNGYNKSKNESEE